MTETRDHMCDLGATNDGFAPLLERAAEGVDGVAVAVAVRGVAADARLAVAVAVGAGTEDDGAVCCCRCAAGCGCGGCEAAECCARNCARHEDAAAGGTCG